jgi:hypothetical protein
MTKAAGACASRDKYLRRGMNLERATLAWNLVGVAVLAVAAVTARSVALAGFGLDSLVEIGASAVVLWELSGTGEDRQRRALRLIGAAFIALSAYIAGQSVIVLATSFHPRHSPLGIAWTAVTAVVMFALATGKARTGRALDNSPQGWRQRDQAACFVVPAMSATPDHDPRSASVRALIPRHSPLVCASERSCVNASGSGRPASDSRAARATSATSAVAVRSSLSRVQCAAGMSDSLPQPVKVPGRGRPRGSLRESRSHVATSSVARGSRRRRGPGGRRRYRRCRIRWRIPCCTAVVVRTR